MVKNVTKCITFLLMAIFSTIALASPEFEARKDLNSIGVKFDNKSFMDAIERGDKLVVGLFVKAKHPLDGMEPIKNRFIDGIPKDALMFFNRTEGAGIKTPEKYEKYELQYLNAAKFSYRYSTLQVTPLMLAVLKEHSDIVDLLIKAGAEVNKIVRYGNQYEEKSAAPLSLAIEVMNFNIVKQLLKAGAKQDLPGRTISQAFSYAEDDALHGSDDQRKSVYLIAQVLDKYYGKPNYTPVVSHFEKYVTK